MTIAIHQPHFFPWLGYLHKIINSDAFVFYDDVQFERRYFQNRAQIKDPNAETRWFGVPVKKTDRSALINQIEISDEFFDPDSLLSTLKNYYRKAPFFDDYFDSVAEIINTKNPSLLDMNLKSTKLFLDLWEIKTPLHLSSELKLIEHEKNLKLVEICKILSSDTYFAGRGGRKYMETEKFDENNIKIEWQLFEPDKVRYPQINGEFVPGLSGLDGLFNIGHEALLDLIVKLPKTVES